MDTDPGRCTLLEFCSALVLTHPQASCLPWLIWLNMVFQKPPYSTPNHYIYRLNMAKDRFAE